MSLDSPSGASRTQFRRRQARHVHVQVDAVQQRPGDLARGNAGSLRALQRQRPDGIAGPAAGTGIHRRHQLESRRELALSRRARDGDHARFQRFAQDFERAPVPFGQLVEEQHAVVRERDLARPRFGATADQRNRAGGVVRRCGYGPLAPARRVQAAAADRGDRRGFQCFGFAGFRQQSGQARRQQRLAAARRADQQQVVTAGGRDFERAPRMRLAAHVAHVRPAMALRSAVRSPPAASCGLRSAAQTSSSVRAVLASTSRASAASAPLPSGTMSLRPARAVASAAGSTPSIGAQFAGQAEFAEEFVLAQRVAAESARWRRGCRARSPGRSGRRPWAGRPARG